MYHNKPPQHNRTTRHQRQHNNKHLPPRLQTPAPTPLTHYRARKPPHYSTIPDSQLRQHTPRTLDDPHGHAELEASTSARQTQTPPEQSAPTSASNNDTPQPPQPQDTPKPSPDTDTQPTNAEQALKTAADHDSSGDDKKDDTIPLTDPDPRPQQAADDEDDVDDDSQEDEQTCRSSEGHGSQRVLNKACKYEWKQANRRQPQQRPAPQEQQGPGWGILYRQAQEQQPHAPQPPPTQPQSQPTTQTNWADLLNRHTLPWGTPTPTALPTSQPLIFSHRQHWRHQTQPQQLRAENRPTKAQAHHKQQPTTPLPLHTTTKQAAAAHRSIDRGHPQTARLPDKPNNQPSRRHRTRCRRGRHS